MKTMADQVGTHVKHYVADQTAAGTAVVFAATDAFKVGKGSGVEITATPTVEALDAFRATRDPREEVQTTLEVAIAVNMDLNSSGTQGTAVDYAPLLETGFTDTAISATSVAGSPSPTTTVFTLTADNLDAGQDGAVTFASGDYVGKTYYFHVVSKDGAALTVYPALPKAPVALDVIEAVINYTCPCQPSEIVTLWRMWGICGTDQWAEYAEAAWANEFVWTFARGERANLAMSGMAHDYARMNSTTLDQAIDDAVVEMSVDDAGNTVGAILYGGTEQFKISSVDSTGLDFGMSRGYGGTSAASHLDEIALTPGGGVTTETTSGDPIRMLAGRLFLDIDTTSGDSIKADSVTITHNTGRAPLFYNGDGGKVAETNAPGDRSTILSINVYIDETNLHLFQKAQARTTLRWSFQCGDTAGRAIFFYGPKVPFNPANVPNKPGEMLTLTMESRPFMGSSTDGDSFQFAC